MAFGLRQITLADTTEFTYQMPLLRAHVFGMSGRSSLPLVQLPQAFQDLPFEVSHIDEDKESGEKSFCHIQGLNSFRVVDCARTSG